MAKRTIPITQLKVGMYVTELDRSWFYTPFLHHRFLIKSEQEIVALRQSGVATVVIDTDLGKDVEDQQISPPPAPSSPSKPAPPPACPTPITADNHQPAPSPKGPVPSSERLSPQQLVTHFSQARQHREQWLARAQALFEKTRVGDFIEVSEAQLIVDDVLKDVLHRQAACLAVLGLGQLDANLQEHGLTVCTLALIVGKALGIPDDQLHLIGLGALLHDIGLTKLPRHMIKRPRTMTPAQQTLYHSHIGEGRRILQKSGLTDPHLLAIVSYHHQFEQLAEPPTPSPANADVVMLTSVVDHYDELLSGQTGLPPLSSSQALSLLYQRCQAHPQWQTMVSLLIRTIGIYPLYSVVSLTSGEVGIVAAITPGKAHLPYLYLCRDPLQQPYVPPIPLDLTQEPEGGRRVKELLDPRRCGIDIEKVLEQVAA